MDSKQFADFTLESVKVISRIIKVRFPNLTTEETLNIATDIINEQFKILHNVFK